MCYLTESLKLSGSHVSRYAAGENSYRSAVAKALDGPAAYLWALDGRRSQPTYGKCLSKRLTWLLVLSLNRQRRRVKRFSTVCVRTTDDTLKRLIFNLSFWQLEMATL
jgi:hypothetical protein